MKKLVLLSLFIALVSTGVRAQTVSLTVGVAKFTIENNAANPDTVTSELTSRLGSYRFIKLVDRTQMDALLKELRLGMSGILDPETAVEQGKVHGVQILIVGSVTKTGMSARAVHMATQKIIGTAVVPSSSDMDECAKKIASGIETYIARENIRSLRNDSPEITLDFWAEKKISKQKIPQNGNVRIGETVIFHFIANRDGYLTIVDIQPGGDVVILYPNDFSTDGKVASGRKYTIPGEEDGFDITVSEPSGTDTIVVFFTNKKVDWLDPKILTGEGFKTVKEGEKAMASRSFTITATKLKSRDWESLPYTIEVVK